MPVARPPHRPPPSPNGAPSLTPRGAYAGRPDIILSRTVTVIGSDNACRLHLVSRSVSKVHALIVNENAGAYIKDTASRHGVIVNGKRVKESRLRDGDALQIGKFEFTFNAGVPPVREGEALDAPAEVYPPAPPALLRADGENLPVPIDGRAMVIGRRDGADVRLLEESCSTHHAVIYAFNGRRYIRDLGSRHGTLVNGEAITEPTELEFGDAIFIAETQLFYEQARPVSRSSIAAEADDFDRMFSVLDDAAPGRAAASAPASKPAPAPAPAKSKPSPDTARGRFVPPAPAPSRAARDAEPDDPWSHLPDEAVAPASPAAAPAANAPAGGATDSGTASGSGSRAGDDITIAAEPDAGSGSGVAAIDQELEIRGFEAEPALEGLDVDADDRVDLEREAHHPDDTIHLPPEQDRAPVQPVMRLKRDPEADDKQGVPPATLTPGAEQEDEKMQSRGGWRALPSGDTAWAADATDAPGAAARTARADEHHDDDDETAEGVGETEDKHEDAVAAADAPASSHRAAHAADDAVAEAPAEHDADEPREAATLEFADAPADADHADVTAAPAPDEPAAEIAAEPPAAVGSAAGREVAEQPLSFDDAATADDDHPADAAAAAHDEDVELAPLPFDDESIDPHAEADALVSPQSRGGDDPAARLPLTAPPDDHVIDAEVEPSTPAASPAATPQGTELALARETHEPGEIIDEGHHDDDADALDIHEHEPIAETPLPLSEPPAQDDVIPADEHDEAETVAADEATPEADRPLPSLELSTDLDADADASLAGAGADAPTDDEEQDAALYPALGTATDREDAADDDDANRAPAAGDLLPPIADEPVADPLSALMDLTADDESRTGDVTAERDGEAAARADAAGEVIAATEPTPESALDLGVPGPDAPLDAADAAEFHEADDDDDDAGTKLDVGPAAADLSDTGVTRSIDEFAGESTGPLVEGVEAHRELPSERVSDEPEATADVVAEAQDEAGSDDEVDEALATRLALSAEPPADDSPDGAAELFAADAFEEKPAVAGTGADVELLARTDEVEVERGEDQDADAGAQEQLDLRPAADGEPEVEPVEPLAEAPEPADPEASEDLDLPPAPAQPAAPAPAGGVTGGRLAELGWGANQDHFLGAMPLDLSKPAPADAAPGRPTGAPRMTPAARAPRIVPPASPPASTGATPLPSLGPLKYSFDPDSGTVARPPAVAESGQPVVQSRPIGFEGLSFGDGGVVGTDVFSLGAEPPVRPGRPSPRGRGRGRDEHVEPRLSDDEPPASKPAAPTRQPGDTEVGGETVLPAVWAGHTVGGEVSGNDTVADTVVSATPPTPAGRGGGDPTESTLFAPAPHAKSRGAVPRAMPAAETDDAATDPDALRPAPEYRPDEPRKRRRRRRVGVRTLVVLMLVLAAAAAAGAIWLAPMVAPRRGAASAAMGFTNFDALTRQERRDLLAEQSNALKEETVRAAAIEKLAALPDAPAGPGFLADQIEYHKVIGNGLSWGADGGGGGDDAAARPDLASSLVVRRTDAVDDGDGARLYAVLLALYDANDGRRGRHERLVREADAARRAHAASKQRMDELRDEIERLRAAAAGRPDPAEVERLEQEVTRLEAAWGEAVAVVKRLDADLGLLRAELPDEPEPAGTGDVPVVDPRLAEIEQQLADAQQQVEVARSARSQRAVEARQALDEAMAAFERHVADARAQAADDPALLAYVESARELQASTREHVDRLITSQEQQHARLSELRAKLADQREAHRAKQWEQDPDLKQYNDQLAVTVRQYNAAVAAGLTKEAEDSQANVKLLEQMIEARQTLIADDAFFASAIEELEKVIDQQQRTMEQDRERTDALLAQMQESFANNPALDEMTREQRELAEGLQARVQEVNRARLDYQAAADASATAAAGAEANDRLLALEAHAAELETRLAERKTTLAAQSERAALAQQQQQQLDDVKRIEASLAAARDEEAAAQQAWRVASRRLEELRQATALARETGERLDARTREAVTLEAQLAQDIRQLQVTSDELAGSVAPITPATADITEQLDPDRRMHYAAASAGGVIVVFAMLIAVTAGAGGPADDTDLSDEADGAPGAPPLARRAPEFHPAMRLAPPQPSGAPTSHGPAGT